MVILDVLQLDVAWSTTQLIVGNWGLASQGVQLIAEPQNSMERDQTGIQKCSDLHEIRPAKCTNALATSRWSLGNHKVTIQQGWDRKDNGGAESRSMM